MSKAKKKQVNKKKKRLKKLLIALVIVFLVLAGALAGAFWYVLGGLNTQEITEDEDELSINQELEENGIVNIALFGVDEETNGHDFSQAEGTRSDSIIVMTIDTNTYTIKLTSILRDSRVPIEGYGEQNINEAYCLGGPVLAIKTLNQCFDLNIREYVSVNFNQLANLVDAVGGVDIKIYKPEVAEINHNLNDYFPGSENLVLNHDAEVTLTGPQAVSYARIRNLDSDTIRSIRQQHVMNSLLNKIQDMPKSQYPSFIREFLKIVQTSLDYTDLIQFTPFATNPFTIETNTIPMKDYETDLWDGLDETGLWCWKYDLNNATLRLHHIIYDTPYDDPTTPEDETAIVEEPSSVEGEQSDTGKKAETSSESVDETVSSQH